MNRFFSFRRSVQALALLVAGWLAGPLAAVQAVEYKAAGTFTVTSANGDKSASDLGGRSSPGGPFTGESAGRWRGKVFDGTATFDYAEGSLLLAFSVKHDAATGNDVGTWEVVGSTGALEGATGGGSITITATSETGGTFTLSGDID